MLNKFIDLERLTAFFQGLKDIFLQKSEASTTYATKTEVENKVDKVEGKGLSTLDYNTSEKSKVDNSINQISVTQNANNVELNLSKVSGNVTAYIDEATPTKAGALSNTDKAKLDKFTEVDNKPYYNGEEIGGGTSAIIKSEEIVSTEGQTVFTLTKGNYAPNENKLAIYIWGVKQYSNAFVETSATSFTLSSGLKAGDKVIAEWFETSPSIKGEKGETGSIDNLTKMNVTDALGYTPLPISNGVLENYTEKLGTIAEHVDGSDMEYMLDLSTGNVFKTNVSTNSSIFIGNAQQGVAHSFTLIINMGSTVRTLTFPASVKWQGGEIPDLTTASKTYVLTFMTVDGGTTWLGMFGGEF